MRVLRIGGGVLLGISGVLMYAASWQRWAGVCGWGDKESPACSRRQDHLFDFLAPMAPWQPVGHAAELAGGSLLVLALALALMPWVLTGRRPGLIGAMPLIGAVVAAAIVGATTLLSGIRGELTTLPGYDLALTLLLFLPPVLFVAWLVSARGWAMAATGLLLLSSPLVAAFTYAVGPYDAQPWWEAISGAFVVAAGLSVICSAFQRERPRVRAFAATSLRQVTATR